MKNPSSQDNNATPVGRYAPTPSGTLHLGNLRTAVAAWCSIRSRGGKFLLRIEDLDRQRCSREMEERQLEDLAALGLDWDEEPFRQSDRDDVYHGQLKKLENYRLVYPCFCSRKDIREALSAPHAPMGNVYPGTCTSLSRDEAQARIANGEQHCWRLGTAQAPRFFFDAFMGQQAINIATDGGDFVVRRADGFYAYQLACAVDDALSGITEVLRGEDLVDSGARQAYLLTCLGLPVPRYLHIPLVVGSDGTRLAKRLGSQDLRGLAEDGHDIGTVLSWIGWSLGQLDFGERINHPGELLERWDVHRIPREQTVLREEDLRRFNPPARP
ncbi:MAG: tRNA glutamyl-Q(34) synthetase GluQRS [Candidatus Sumerlaeia bacterium]|nr:tRNA glutamyl-Q(34) synthetase GluQRS [Candidatus Sumerlaeia bacterium]